MPKSPPSTGKVPTPCVVGMLLLATLSGCASWQLPRIDPTGERIFIWPHEQPPAAQIGPPIASTGPTASPFPPAAALGPDETAPSTLPPQTAVDESGQLPSPTYEAAPLWPDPRASAIFPQGLAGAGPCTDKPCPLPGRGTAVAPLAAAAVPAPADRVQITPQTVVAPVGSEVVLRAGICTDDGYLLTKQQIEWLLDSVGVGQIVAVGEPTLLHVHHRPRKVDNHYAVGRTAHRESLLDRGTPQVDDDVLVQKGESWVSISSTVEGASRVTAVAKEVESWQTRRAAATVHWVDAQWVFPKPAVNAVGQPHVLTTSVTRLSDSRPLAGYMVRYELLDPDVAGFAPDGAQVAEVLTDNAGRAAVELYPHEARAGTARVKVRVIRPALAGPIASPRLLLAGSTITKTWTAPDLAIETTGPSVATLGAQVTYRIVVSNRGQLPISRATVSARLPAGLALVGSNPAAQEAAGPLSWTFDTIEAGATRTIILDLRAEQAGRHEVCAAVQSAQGQSAESCATTEVTATAARLEIQLEGPQTATVGEEITYTVTVLNRGNAPATNLVITDRFDPGLSHAGDPEGEGEIERDFGELAPGESGTVYVTFDVEAEGRLCHEVEVTGDGGLRAVQTACVEATAPAEPPPPEFEVTKIAPRRAEVGEQHIFRIVVQNTGDAPLENIEIEEQFDDALEPRRATEGYLRVGTDMLKWTLESLAPGERKVYEVDYEMMRSTAGMESARTTTVVLVGEERRVAQADVEILPREEQPPEQAEPAEPAEAPPPQPGPEITFEVFNRANPVPAGERTTFQVFITNKGQQPAFDVVPQVRYSAELRPVLDVINRSLATQNIQARVDGQTLRFTPIRELPPGDRVGLTLVFDATREGTARVEFSATSQQMTEPLIFRDTVTVLPR